MARYNAMTESFEEVTIFDKPALFTPLRIERSTVPNGFHLYEVRHDDDCQGNAVQIARSIVVNHWGSLITQDEIDLPADGYLDIKPDDLNYGVGDIRSMREAMERWQSSEQASWRPATVPWMLKRIPRKKLVRKLRRSTIKEMFTGHQAILSLRKLQNKNKLSGRDTNPGRLFYLEE